MNPLPAQRSKEETKWDTTLRAQQDRITFDLFRADRPSQQDVWKPAIPLAALNQPDSSEGAAFVSPDGAFLYFASDRVQRENESRNLDLFRSALTNGTLGEPENLGASVNTLADETEPALSPEGFTLVFSSNRAGTDRLYSTRAREIIRRSEWTAWNLPSRRSTWIIGLSILLAALLALAFWKRNQVAEQLWPARFIIGSIVINVLLLVMLAVWRFPEVFEAVANVFEDSVPAPDMLDESGHQSHEDGREAYEKVADLKSLEAESIPDVVKTVNEPTSIPEPNQRLSPTISAIAAKALPPDQVMFVTPTRSPRPTPKPKTDSPFSRRRPSLPTDALAMLDVTTAELPAESLPEEVTPTEQTPDISQAARDATEIPRERVTTIDTPNAAPPKAVADLPMKVVADPDVPAAVSQTNPFKKRPRNRREPIAAAESKLSDLPDQEVVLKEDPLSQANSPVQRVIKTNPTKPTAKLANTNPDATPGRLVATRPIPVSSKQLSTIQSNLPTPFSPRKRSRPVKAVASLDADLADIPTATEIPAKTSVEGTRPKFERTANVENTQNLSSRNTLAMAASPDARAVQLNPQSVEPKPNEIALASTAPNRTLKLPRKRIAPRIDSVIESADALDSEQLAEGESNPVATTPGAAEVPFDRQESAGGKSSPLSARSKSTILFDSLAGQLNAPQKPRENSIEVASIKFVRDPLQRRRPAVRSFVDTPATIPKEITDLPAGDAVSDDETVEASETVVERVNARLAADVATPRQQGGPASEIRNRIVVGEFSELTNDAPLALSPVASRLNRKRARAMKVALANDNVGLQALFTLRQGDTRRKYIKLLGGSEETERAVNLGLDWLAKNQSEDGGWDLRKHQAQTTSMTAGTGLGVLPFLAAGYTHNHSGKYQEVVRKAIQRLIKNQQESGELTSKGDAQRMYSHGIAAIALCEAYGMSQDKELKASAQKSLDFIVAAQHKGTGGWRYNPNDSADTSVVGWQVMALKSGEMAGLSVPVECYKQVGKWLNAVEAKQGPGGTFGYQNRNATPAMTAEGLLCLQFMGTQRNDPKMRYGADYVLRSLPERKQQLTSYYWYYATQAMYHMQGDYWETWNERTSKLLIETQQTTGKNAGTWNPIDRWEKSGGRVYATSLKLLMLEVYYRHLPLYEELEF
jgi:hypothetical protein